MNDGKHPPLAPPKIGVLLVNLGTPDAPTRGEVKKYLAEFLKDRRVIELSPLLWWPILHGIILNTRPQKSAKAYQKIWDGQRSGGITGDYRPLRNRIVPQSPMCCGRSQVYFQTEPMKSTVNGRRDKRHRMRCLTLHPP